MSTDPRYSAEVVMYTLSGCPYCWRARRRLRRKGALFEEIRFRQREKKTGRAAIARLGGRTFPQILIDGYRLGGNAELIKADRSAELDQRLCRDRPSPPMPRH
jgi:glutaredoxin 3